MKTSEKRRIIRELTANLRKTLLEAVPAMPDSWDGNEIRELMADVARERFAGNLGAGKLSAYQNDRAVLDLP